MIATTKAGTERALHVARELVASGRPPGDAVAGEPVVLLIPQRLDRVSSRSLSDVAEAYRLLASASGVNAVVRVCMCPAPWAISRLISTAADIVIGGSRRLWWPTAEQRLAWHLAASGHRVRFANVDDPVTNCVVSV